MNIQRSILAGFIFTVILALGLLGGVWSHTFAQGTGPTIPTVPTVPTVSPAPQPTATKMPGDLPEPFPKITCIGASISPAKEVDLFELRFPNTRSTARWGGVLNSSGSACQEAYEVYCIVPVRYLPERAQLHYYRQGVQVFQKIDGKVDSTPSCSPKLIYFDLSAYERFMYDHFKDRFGFFNYNPETHTWDACPEVIFDKEAGLHGRLSCRTINWGFFAIGWQAKK